MPSGFLCGTFPQEVLLKDRMAGDVRDSRSFPRCLSNRMAHMRYRFDSLQRSLYIYQTVDIVVHFPRIQRLKEEIPGVSVSASQREFEIFS